MAKFEISPKMGLMLLMLSVLLEIVQGQNVCGSGTGWRYSPHSRKCYKLFEHKIGWTMAELKCVFQGAHQVSIHDLNDNQFVAEIVKKAGIIWLGAAQFGSSTNYVWSDYTPFSFEHWKNGVRPRYHPGRKFVGIPGEYVVASTGLKTNAITGDWLQTCCKVPAAYICQKPAMQPLPEIIEDDTNEPASDPQQQDVQSRAARLRL